MWQLVTSVPKKEQTIILLDSLEGNAKVEQAVSDLTATEFNNDEGINTLFAKLDLVFKDETLDEAYSTYSNFISFNKKDDMIMTDYILEFEHLYCKMMEYEMKLPDAVLTFNLLDGANITDDERKLALTVCSITVLNFDRLKSALKRLFKNLH